MADAPLDQIHLRDLTLRCIIGTDADERRNKQDVEIHVTLQADLARAGQSDDLADTVDYRSVEKDIVAMVEQSSCLLIERLGERIAEICLSHDGVQRVRVLVEKPGALRFARTVGVEIVRPRGRDG